MNIDGSHEGCESDICFSCLSYQWSCTSHVLYDQIPLNEWGLNAMLGIMILLRSLVVYTSRKSWPVKCMFNIMSQ